MATAQGTQPSVIDCDDAAVKREGTASARYVSAEVVDGDQLISTAGAATGFVVNRFAGSDGGCRPGDHAKRVGGGISGSVLGNCHGGRCSTSGVAGTCDFIGHIIAPVVRVFVLGVAAGRKQHFDRVGIQVDGTFAQIFPEAVVDEGCHESVEG